MRLREAAQQALEALIWTTGSEDFSEGGQAREGALNLLFPAITSLRAALKQPEPRNQCGELCERAKLCPICCRTIEELEGSHLETVSPDMQSAGGVHPRVSNGADRGMGAMMEIQRLRAAGLKALEALEEIEWSSNSQWQCDRAKVSISALRDALTEEATQRLTVDPVAYVNDEGWFRSAEDADAAFRATAQPLYAAPPKREPLTDAEINGLELPASGTATIRDMVRLIERAHGIGGEE